MLLSEWNMETALEVRFDEGIAIGVEKERSDIKDLLRQGISTEELLERLENR